jgi:hypothetical protein
VPGCAPGNWEQLAAFLTELTPAYAAASNNGEYDPEKHTGSTEEAVDYKRQHRDSHHLDGSNGGERDYRVSCHSGHAGIQGNGKGVGKGGVSRNLDGESQLREHGGS